MTQPLPAALAALAPVVDLLEQLGIPYHVGGSLASSAYGVPRTSVDVDLVAELGLDHVDRFVDELAAAYYVDRLRVAEAVRSRQAFNVIHLDTMMKVDVFVPETHPFARSEQERARPEALAAGSPRTYIVKSPEDLVLRKLLWYRAGHEASEQQWGDIVGVLTIRADRLDRQYLARWAADLGVADLLERALREVGAA